ncbi:MAG: indole-3-glycerol phosphate synthase TrpC [Elusimicrobiota bacterium]
MSGGTVLEKISASTRGRLAREKERVSEAALRSRVPAAREPLDFAAALAEGGLRVIAEVKRASPSAGAIAEGLDPVATAEDYAANGAAAVSVLTEPEFFGGSLDHLAAVRAKVGLPLLMKDFLIDEYQLLQARVSGADCVLLIVALLGEERLRRMLAAARRLGLSALVEVHTGAEMEAALGCGARIIGVNNRDLKTLRVDLDVSRRLAARAAGRDVTLVCESGIRTRAEIEELFRIGYKAFLVGTHLIKSGSPGRALAELLGTESPMARVKICGLTRPDDACAAAELGAWAVGLIFAPGSARRVSVEAARRVTALLPEKVLRVGVFLDQPEAEIRRVDRELGLDLIQLHGAETNLLCRTLGPERCVKAVFLGGEEGVERALRCEAGYLLVDRPRTSPPAGAVDWGLSGRLAAKRPRTLLAGALTPANVGEAVRQVRPWGVDVSSGVERSPGVKDERKLRDFFAAVRRPYGDIEAPRAAEGREGGGEGNR